MCVCESNCYFFLKNLEICGNGGVPFQRYYINRLPIEVFIFIGGSHERNILLTYLLITHYFSDNNNKNDQSPSNGVFKSTRIT